MYGLRRRRTALLFRPKLQHRGADLQRKHQPDLRLAPEIPGYRRSPMGGRRFLVCMDLGDDGVMVSIPGSDLARIVGNLKEMRSKKAFAE